IINHHPEIDVLTYLDADLFLFSSLDPVYAELGSRSILIHEHRYTPELAYLLPESGRFNVGLLCFRRDVAGMGALAWWRERCLEWCYQRTEDGKMGDQMYLDDWPTRFQGVVVLQNLGAGLAPWNFGQYRIGAEPGRTPTVNGGPIVFFHFHSLAVPRRDVVLVTRHTSYPVTPEILNGCYVRYAEVLWTQGAAVKAVLPTFSFGMSEKITLTPHHILLVRQGPQPVELGIGRCRDIPLSSGWDARMLAHGDAAPPPAVTSPGHALLAALAGRPITQRIEGLFVLGAERMTEAAIFFRLFPRLQHLYVFEPRPASRERLKSFTSGDARIRVFPHEMSNGALSAVLGQGDVRPDMLMIEAPGAELSMLAALPPAVRRGVQIVHTAASAAGGNLKTRLDPEFMFIAFRPAGPGTPSDGDALYVNRDAINLLAQPPERERA
ncbi:MAG TPA: hypothetical protein VFH73_03130, partial [Polyangia bacterium]|nr:hypothetical protein [Polyangia bacterium]